MARQAAGCKAGKFVVAFALLLPCVVSPAAISDPPEIRGQLSAWAVAMRNGETRLQYGGRYIPELAIGMEVAQGWSLDVETAVKVYGVGLAQEGERPSTDSDVDLYRAWLRSELPQFEVRAGLQKINFGSAALLRPLMWFDRVDPRDPLQLTDGVYAVLSRYYFLNNANLWLWMLYGNDDLKGWEEIPSDENVPEFGGRIQVPVAGGEAGFSYHHRQTAPEGRNPMLESDFAEDRFGIDGKWDPGVGLWFEGVVVHQDLRRDTERYRRIANVGMDYTFGVGNGLHALGELFAVGRAEDMFGSGDDVEFSAVEMDYPVSVLDTVTAIAYYDWERDEWYRFAEWHRRYDRWGIHVIGFWNPDGSAIYGAASDRSALEGKGVQVLAVFNH